MAMAVVFMVNSTVATVESMSGQCGVNSKIATTADDVRVDVSDSFDSHVPGGARQPRFPAKTLTLRGQK